MDSLNPYMKRAQLGNEATVLLGTRLGQKPPSRCLAEDDYVLASFTL